MKHDRSVEPKLRLYAITYFMNELLAMIKKEKREYIEALISEKKN